MANNYPKNFDPALYLGADVWTENRGPWAEWLAGKDAKFPKKVAHEYWFIFITALQRLCCTEADKDGAPVWPEKYFENIPDFPTCLNRVETNVLFREDLTKAFDFVMRALGDDGLKGDPFDLERRIGEESGHKMTCAYVILQIDNAITGLFADDLAKVATGFTFAYMGAEHVNDEVIFFHLIRNAQANARSQLGRNAQRARMLADPKQTEKASVRECWQDWQKTPSNYKSKAAFARDMQSKYEHLTSHKVITDWCLEWEKCNPTG